MKQFSRVTQSVTLLALVAATLGFVGCAEDVGTLDRTRPDRVDKSIFDNDDEWYFRQSVIDTDFQATFLFQGLETPLKRIRWTITEDTLFAHTTVEPAIGSSKGLEDKEDRRLGVVAAFPITGHFDVQRGYNPQTGQLSNVVSENTTDHLWYDRKYMRVDWGRMSADSIGYFSAMGHFSAVTRTLSEKNKEADPNRTRISDDVIDTVTEFYLEPNPMSCYQNFGISSVGDCEAGAIKLRSYFMKVPKKQTYEPLPYRDVERFADADGHLVRTFDKTDPSGIGLASEPVYCDTELFSGGLSAKGALNAALDKCKPLGFDMFKRFGYFRTERTIYDSKYQGSIEQRVFFANRRNIWEDAYDADGKVKPLSERTPKQIVYYTNVGFPKERWPAVQKIAEKWNEVFTETIALTHNYNTCDVAGVKSAVNQYISTVDKNAREALGKGKNVGQILDAIKEDKLLKEYSEKANEKLKSLTNEQIHKVCDNLYGSSFFQYLYRTIDGSSPVAGVFGLSAPPEAEKFFGGFNKKLKEKLNEIRVVAISESDPEYIECTADNVIKYVNEYKKLRRDAIAEFAEAGALKTNWKAKEPTLSPIATYMARDSLLSFYYSFASAELEDELVKDSSSPEALKNTCTELENKMSSSPLVKSEARPKFDFNNEKVKAIIAQGPSNQGCKTLEAKFADKNPEVEVFESFKPGFRDCSGDMYVIKPNSCSPRMLVEWKNAHSEYADLFDGMGEKELEGLTPKKLEKFCAKLEIATENDADNRFDWQRLGDLHYSFINWDFSHAPWLGYGPSAADPVTGEIISASANFAGEVLDSYSAGGLKYVKLTEGKVSEKDLIWGDYLRDKYIATRKAAEKEAGVGGLASRMSLTQLKPVTPKPALETALAQWMTKSDNKAPDVDALQKVVEKLSSLGSDFTKKVEMGLRQAQAGQKLQGERILKVLNDDKIRAELMKDPNTYAMVKALAYERFGKTDPTEDQLAQAYNFMMNPVATLEANKQIERKLAEQNIMSRESFENSMGQIVSYLGVAGYFGQEENGKPKFSDEEIMNYFANNIFYSTQLHEVGHTLGLRHNFKGSADAMNYDPVYWKLVAKVKEHQELISENRFSKEDLKRQLMADRPAVCGKESDVVVLESTKDLNYLTKAQVKCLLNGYEIKRPYFSASEFREASIMDYTPGLTSGFNGLGRYDNAAIQFAYANKVQVFNEDVYFGKFMRFLQELKLVGYEKVPSMLARNDLFSAYEAATKETPDDSVMYQIGVDRMNSSRSWVDISDYLKEMRDGLDYQTASAHLSIRKDTRRPNYSWSDRTVPFRFCSDDYEGGVLYCKTFDYGATNFEILDYAFDDFRVTKNMSRYRRGRNSNNFVSAYIGRLFRTMSYATSPFYYYSIYRGLNAGDLTVDLKKAAAEGLNFLAEIYSQPEPGDYCLSRSGVYINTGTEGKCGDGSKAVSIGVNDGGYYGFAVNDDYYYLIDRVGTAYDKQAAIQMMFNVSGNFAFNLLLSADLQNGNTSYWTEFQDAIYHFVDGVINDNVKETGGVINAKGDYEPLKLLDAEQTQLGGQKVQQVGTRISTRNGYTNEWYTIIGSLVANNTYLDNEVNLGEYMKVCYSKDECAAKYPTGTKFATFEHPYTAQVYTAPISKTLDGQERSITANTIDELNLYKRALPIVMNQFDSAKAAFESAQASGTVTKNIKDRYETLKTRKNDIVKHIEYLVGRLDRIRYVTKVIGK